MQGLQITVSSMVVEMLPPSSSLQQIVQVQESSLKMRWIFIVYVFVSCLELFMPMVMELLR